MLADKEIDIVYIANTNDKHVPRIEMCLNAGKHVMCEKPMTLNAADAKKVTALAKEKILIIVFYNKMSRKYAFIWYEWIYPHS